MEENYPETANTLDQSIYVYDLLTGADSEDNPKTVHL